MVIIHYFWKSTDVDEKEKMFTVISSLEKFII